MQLETEFMHKFVIILHKIIVCVLKYAQNPAQIVDILNKELKRKGSISTPFFYQQSVAKFQVAAINGGVSRLRFHIQPKPKGRFFSSHLQLRDIPSNTSLSPFPRIHPSRQSRAAAARERRAADRVAARLSSVVPGLHASSSCFDLERGDLVVFHRRLLVPPWCGSWFRLAAVLRSARCHWSSLCGWGSSW